MDKKKNSTTCKHCGKEAVAQACDTPRTSRSPGQGYEYFAVTCWTCGAVGPGVWEEWPSRGIPAAMNAYHSGAVMDPPEGLAHWRCVSRKSNSWWIREDGLEETVDVLAGGTIAEVLGEADAVFGLP